MRAATATATTTNTNNHNGIAPSAIIPSSGVSRMTPYMLGWLVLLTVLHTLLWLGFRQSPNILWLPPAKTCRETTAATTTGTTTTTTTTTNDHDATEQAARISTTTICSRSDLFAFEVTCLVALAACGLAGFWTWHISRRAHTAVPQTPAGRIFGYLPEAERLAATNLIFQVWNLVVSLFIPEYQTPIMLAHHAMAMTVSWCSIRYTYLQYYGVFFVGLSEVSSIFLVFVGIAKHFPPEPGTLYDKVVTWFGGPLFAVTFLYYRVLLWWPISVQLFRDAFYVLQTGQAAKLRPGKTWVLYVFLALNVPLGVLQLYWATLIFEGALKLLPDGK